MDIVIFVGLLIGVGYLIIRWIKQIQRCNLENKIQAIETKYRLHDIAVVTIGHSSAYASMLLNNEVINFVNRHKRESLRLIERQQEINSSINQILDKNDLEVKQRLFFLQSKDTELAALKNESDAIAKELNSRKIQLCNEKRDMSRQCSDAFFALKSSKICRARTVEIANLLIDSRPAELDMFRYENEPVIIMLDSSYYCIFSNVILVFDYKGIFLTALDPIALNVSVSRKTESVHVSENRYSSDSWYSSYAAADSKRLTRGITKHTWMYEKKDGSPDRRYKNNELLSYRIDEYEYAEISIGLSMAIATYIVSSNDAIEKFSRFAEEYPQKYSHLREPIGDLLELLRQLSNEGEKLQIGEMIQLHDSKQSKHNYFCQELIA